MQKEKGICWGGGINSRWMIKEQIKKKKKNKKNKTKNKSI
jgi:hypothetical protein